jgi:hypothetical protein
MTGVHCKRKPVGYGHPPRHSQFKKGQSENPAGRPKGSKNKMMMFGRKLDKDILKQAERYVSVAGTEGTKRIPLREAIVGSILVNAAKGGLGFQKLKSVAPKRPGKM